MSMCMYVHVYVYEQECEHVCMYEYEDVRMYKHLFDTSEKLIVYCPHTSVSHLFFPFLLFLVSKR